MAHEFVDPQINPDASVPTQLPTIAMDSEIPCALGRSIAETASTSIVEPVVNTRFHPTPAKSNVPKNGPELDPQSETQESS